MANTTQIKGFLADHLQVLNLKRARELQAMTDDALWAFVNENFRTVKRLVQGGQRFRTGAFFAYPHSEEHFRKIFFRDLSEIRNCMVNMLIRDFCLGRQKIVLGHWGKSGYLDTADSCSSLTSDEVMPLYDEDDDWLRQSIYFNVLEIRQVDNILASLKANIHNLQMNDSTDISRIEKIRNFCLKHQEFKIIYVYDL